MYWPCTGKTNLVLSVSGYTPSLLSHSLSPITTSALSLSLPLSFLLSLSLLITCLDVFACLDVCLP